MLAEEPPSIAQVHETSARAEGARPPEQALDPLDDWLGDVLDEDWSENAAERDARRRATPAYQGLPVPAGDNLWREPPADLPTPARPVDAARPSTRVVERRRLVAGVVLAAVLGLAVVTGVLLLRGGPQEPVTSVAEPTTVTPEPSESTPSSTSTTTTPTVPSTTTSPTTPSTSGASTFTLPEGTKLRRGEGDPAVISELQQALSSAGYDPGPVDGTFGARTEAAVVAFQQANGLSADGVVGPETASALNGSGGG